MSRQGPNSTIILNNKNKSYSISINIPTKLQITHLECNGIPIAYITQNLRIVMTGEKGLTIEEKCYGDVRYKEA